MKIVYGIGVLFIIGLFAFVTWSPENAPSTVTENESMMADKQADMETSIADRSVFSEGVYVVNPAASQVNWAGKKPLIEGYVNSGSISVTEGTIEVTPESATGNFIVDMDTLSVSGTPAKPGRESSLESHLKGEGWFNVAEFPQASFTITKVEPRVDSDTSFIYDVTGDLVMKGQTGELSFPATIYVDDSGALHADASFEFDRTKWGITAGSGSIFDNLADNVIDDMVALSFNLVAEKQ